MSHTGPYQGSRIFTGGAIPVITLTNDMNVVAGSSGEILIENPGDSTILVMHIAASGDTFFLRLGDYIARTFLDGDVAAASMTDAVTFDDVLDTATRDAGSWIDDGFVDGMVVTVAGSAATLIGTPGIVIDDTGNTYTRDAGSFLDEGFVPGIDFTVGGSASNNGSDTIVTVTDTVITVASITVAEVSQTDLTMVSDLDNDGTMTVDGDPTALVLQLTAADVTITLGEQNDITVSGVADQITVTAHGYETGQGPYKLSTGAAMTALTSIVINGGGPDNLTRTVGSWLDEGFIPGMTITIAGSASNEGTALVLTTVGVLTGETAQTDLSVTAPGVLPTGVDATTLYWLRAVDDDTLEFYLSLATAQAVTNSLVLPVDMSTAIGGGLHTIGGMANHELNQIPSATTTDGYTSLHIGYSAGRFHTFSAPDCITLVAADPSDIIYCWWLP
jgi:hypothetical protein